MNQRPIVKASEIQSYVYCPRAWWLQEQGKLPVTKAMEAGIAGHNTLARSVHGLTWKRVAALVCLVTGILLLLALLLVSMVI